MKKNYVFKAVMLMLVFAGVIVIAIITKESTIDPLFEKDEIIIDSFPELDTL